MGFIEETGAAQHYRDARITTIYEGTTGIQANDFIGRKTARDGGAVARGHRRGDGEGRARARRAMPTPISRRSARGLRKASRAARAAAEWMVPAYGTNPRAAHAVAVPYLKLWGLVAGGWQLGRGALAAARHLAAGTGDASFLDREDPTARFYAEALLPQAAGLAQAVTGGGESALRARGRAVLTVGPPRPAPREVRPGRGRGRVAR